MIVNACPGVPQNQLMVRLSRRFIQSSLVIEKLRFIPELLLLYTFAVYVHTSPDSPLGEEYACDDECHREQQEQRVLEGKHSGLADESEYHYHKEFRCAYRSDVFFRRIIRNAECEIDKVYRSERHYRNYEESSCVCAVDPVPGSHNSRVTVSNAVYAVFEEASEEGECGSASERSTYPAVKETQHSSVSGDVHRDYPDERKHRYDGLHKSEEYWRERSPRSELRQKLCPEIEV